MHTHTDRQTYMHAHLYPDEAILQRGISCDILPRAQECIMKSLPCELQSHNGISNINGKYTPAP